MSGLSKKYVLDTYLKVKAILDCHGLDCYVVGAFAAQFWYDTGIATIPYRGTRDIDLAIGVPNYDFYKVIREELSEEGVLDAKKRGRHTLVLKDGTIVDLLPFSVWALERSGKEVATQWSGPEDLVGFTEVSAVGLRDYEFDGVTTVAASPASIVGLKLFALDDRLEMRLKDAGDTGQIIRYYQDLEAETVWDDHNDLDTDGGDWPTQCRMAFGRELHAVFAKSPDLIDRLDRILNDIITEKLRALDTFAKGANVEPMTAKAYLRDVLFGFRQNWTRDVS